MLICGQQKERKAKESVSGEGKVIKDEPKQKERRLKKNRIEKDGNEGK